MLDTIIKSYKEINFVEGESFSWNPHNKTIIYLKNDQNEYFSTSLLHEIAHADLNHFYFKNDLNLIKMERDAWARAVILIKKFGLTINKDYIEDCMDSYRDWLYSRSKCPHCQYVGFQSALNIYFCIYCSITWKVPDSRLCAVKRKILT